MTELGSAQPRWGNQNRDQKAEALLETMVRCRGRSVAQGTWVDIGCGSGGIAAALATRVTHVVGIDPEPWPDWSVAAAAHGNLSFRMAPCDSARPPLSEASADVVVCNQVYEHVADPLALIANIRSILKPGGVCYFAGPNLLWPIEPHVFWPFVHWLPRQAAKRVMHFAGSRRADDLDAFSTHYWNLVHWFRQAGLTVEEGLKWRTVLTFEQAGLGALASLLGRLPRWGYKMVLPFAPTFVFVLGRPHVAEEQAPRSEEH